MKAPPGGFNDSALTAIFQKTIPQFKLKTASTAPDTPAPVSNSNTTASQSAASKPSSPTPAGSIVESLVGGVAALVLVAGGFLYFFHFRRVRDQSKAKAANPSELPSYNVQEVHGDHRPTEIDGNILLEIDGTLYVEAPAGALSELSCESEMPSSIDLPRTTWGKQRESTSGAILSKAMG